MSRKSMQGIEHRTCIDPVISAS